MKLINKILKEAEDFFTPRKLDRERAPLTPYWAVFVGYWPSGREFWNVEYKEDTGTAILSHFDSGEAAVNKFKGNDEYSFKGYKSIYDDNKVFRGEEEMMLFHELEKEKGKKVKHASISEAKSKKKDDFFIPRGAEERQEKVEQEKRNNPFSAEIKTWNPSNKEGYEYGVWKIRHGNNGFIGKIANAFKKYGIALPNKVRKNYMVDFEFNVTGYSKPWRLYHAGDSKSSSSIVIIKPVENREQINTPKVEVALWRELYLKGEDAVLKRFATALKKTGIEEHDDFEYFATSYSLSDLAKYVFEPAALKAEVIKWHDFDPDAES